MIRRRKKPKTLFHFDPRVAMIVGMCVVFLGLVRGCGIIFFGTQGIESGTVERIFEDDRFPK